jgi:hypothetical protein
MFSGTGDANHMRDAIQVVNKYYEAVRIQEYDMALSCFSDSSFEKMNTDIWKKTLAGRTGILGEPVDCKLALRMTWIVRKPSPKRDSGTYFTLKYKVNYANFSSKERFDLFRKNPDGLIQILQYTIDCKGLDGRE